MDMMSRCEALSTTLMWPHRSKESLTLGFVEKGGWKPTRVWSLLEKADVFVSESGSRSYPADLALHSLRTVYDEKISRLII